MSVNSTEIIPDNKTYELKCEIFVKELIGFDIFTETRNIAAKCVALIPDPVNYDIAAVFLYNWMPDETDQHIIPEVPMWLNAPVNGPCRGAVRGPNEWCNRPHIFIMGTGAEDKLRRHHGETIDIKVLPQSEDKICDKSQEVARTLR